MTHRPALKLAAVAMFAAAFLGACKSDSDSKSGTQSALPEDVTSIIFLQRAARNDGVGDVFQYTSFAPGGRIVKLEPPSADGKLTVLTTGPMWDGADFQSWDLSFDARTIAFSARTADSNHYQIYTMGVDGSNPRQVTAGPYDYVFPVFLPGNKIMFTTSKVVEDGQPQFRDEYERGTTAQAGTIDVGGTNESLGPRNVSHRVSPALLPDGNILYTQWEHLGNINEGDLRIMNQDLTGMREAFGTEGGLTNSYLKARYIETYQVSPNKTSFRVVAVATSRDRTLQSGKLILVSLSDSEANASAVDLTPLVPGGRELSQPGIGRYYDAEPIGNPRDMKFLVSWADGPVQSEALALAGTYADFGVYVFDAKTGTRYPIYNDVKMWDVLARPVLKRAEPPYFPSTVGNGDSFVLGAMNVYDSSIGRVQSALKPGSVVKARILEGFSTEEGFPNMFGLTEFDGQSLYGEVPVYSDGSFAAKVPANVPLHVQMIDKFAMSLASEQTWISGRPGEERFCGGCHESRSAGTVIEPGSTRAMQIGPIDLDVTRAERVTRAASGVLQASDFTYGNMKGAPWDLAIQPFLTAKCAGCHDGDPAKPGNKQYTVTDLTAGTSQTFVFDLTDKKVQLVVGERADEYGDYLTASYVSLVGIDMALGDNNVQITGEQFSYITPESALNSEVIRRLNPPQRFPAVDTNVRAFPGKPVHPVDVGGTELTPDEYYRLILNIDMGAQFLFRENRAAYNGGN